eukprot:48041-Prorocentrum_lima.AAC.1
MMLLPEMEGIEVSDGESHSSALLTLEMTDWKGECPERLPARWSYIVPCGSPGASYHLATREAQCDFPIP